MIGGYISQEKMGPSKTMAAVLTKVHKYTYNRLVRSIQMVSLLCHSP